VALVLTGRSGPCRSALAALPLLGLLLGGCASARPPRFRLAEPILRLDDEKPIPVPRATERKGGNFYFHSTVSNPRYRLPYGPRIRLAADVNALDETVASTFYAPRLAGGAVTPEAVGRGPGETVPVPPLAVYDTLGGLRRAFLARDSRGRRYSPEGPRPSRGDTVRGPRAFRRACSWAPFPRPASATTTPTTGSPTRTVARCGRYACSERG
jgi:hypothetical protein